MILIDGISFYNLQSDHLIIVLLGYVVCFICLAILWGVFTNLPTILHIKIRGKSEKTASAALEENSKGSGQLTGEQAAAISAALHLFIEDLHDEERRVLTIQKISRRYSPWSSKIYSVTQGLNKRF